MTVSRRRASATKRRKRSSRETGSLAAPNSIPASALEEAFDGMDTPDPWILERAMSEARSIKVLGAAMASNPDPASPELARKSAGGRELVAQDRK
jgi:hypothetical protein